MLTCVLREVYNLLNLQHQNQNAQHATKNTLAYFYRGYVKIMIHITAHHDKKGTR